jgi:hypothetical protein
MRHTAQHDGVPQRDTTYAEKPCSVVPARSLATMSNPFLTAVEIDHLTDKDGKHRRASTQAAILRSMGIEFKQRPDCSLVVLREHAFHLLGGTMPFRVNRNAEPNFAALDA